MVGGVEVTLLGVRFSKDWKFGSVSKKVRPPRIGVTIVSCACCLFHQSVACTIVISFKHQGVVETQDLAIGRQPTTFKFIDDDEVCLFLQPSLFLDARCQVGQRHLFGAQNSGWGLNGPLVHQADCRPEKQC